MASTRIFFIRGLNTYGDDLIHLGPWTYGLMHERIQQGLSELNLSCHAAIGLGVTSLELQTEKAYAHLTSLPDWENPELKWHLVGHSSGGLIARALAHHLDRPLEKILSITTLATPHFGSKIAARISRLYQEQHWLRRTCGYLGYNLEPKVAIFKEFQPENMMVFNRRYEDISGISYSCLQFKLQLKEMSWPLRLVTQFLDKNHNGDGMVDFVSQKWGESLGVFALDHLQQLGYHFVLMSKIKSSKEAQFQSMLQTLVRHWKDCETQSGLIALD